jgi:hypothetical protein
LLTTLRLSGRKPGILLNVNVKLLDDGITRRVLAEPTAGVSVPPP